MALGLRTLAQACLLLLLPCAALAVTDADCSSNSACSNCLRQNIASGICKLCLDPSVLDQGGCFNCLSRRINSDPSGLGCQACATTGFANQCTNCLAMGSHSLSGCMGCASPFADTNACYNCLYQNNPDTACISCQKNSKCYDCLSQRRPATDCQSCVGAFQEDLCYNCISQGITNTATQATCRSCDAPDRTAAQSCYNCLSQRKSPSTCYALLRTPCGTSSCDASQGEICYRGVCARTCDSPATTAIRGLCTAGVLTDASDNQVWCAAKLNSNIGIYEIDTNDLPDCTSDDQCPQGQFCTPFAPNLSAGYCSLVAPPSCFPLLPAAFGGSSLPSHHNHKSG